MVVFIEQQWCYIGVEGGNEDEDVVCYDVGFCEWNDDLGQNLEVIGIEIEICFGEMEIEFFQ